MPQMNAHTAYDELVTQSRERTMLASCIELLGWDELTYMPRGGVENRGGQLAYLMGLYHEVSTDPRLGELLDVVAGSPLVADPLSPPAVNVREWRRTYLRQMRLPRALVQELAATTTTAQQEWAEARRNNDYSRFRPWLERILLLKRREADCLEHDGTPYDALLEDYEPGARSADLARMFAALRSELSPLLAEIAAGPRRTKPAILRREYPIDRQRIFAEAVAADLGFDFERGRLDVTTHPFYSVMGPGDCRITTRYNHSDFGDALFSMLHELGHGLYEQGLDPGHFGTPLGESSSMSLHESQSRLWEKFVGLSLPFWRHFFPRARDIFHDTLHDVPLADFHRAVNHVQPGWNRVRADAVSYDLHILVRFELELALLSGDLKPADLPSVWNEKYRDYLGVVPASDTEGCLQDGHWASGQFGYFPVYTLGNICAAQLYAQARRDLPCLDSDMAAGRFGDLLEWLRENIYRHGQRYSAAELMERVSGSPPDHQPLIDALRQTCAELTGRD
jgi:carboxypeptidase Taq